MKPSVHSKKLRGDRSKSSNAEKLRLARPKTMRGGGRKLLRKAQQEREGEGEGEEEEELLRGPAQAWLVPAPAPAM
jgi:hypothetical protein